MALILKSNTDQAAPGAERMLRDALVTDGTLLLHDFDNKGTLRADSLAQGAPVYDLSREVSMPLGIANSVEFKHNADDDPKLTPGKGLRVDNLGTNPSPSQNLGIDLGTDLLNYLSTKTGNILMVAWLRLDTSIVRNGAFITSTGNGGGNNYPIRFNVADGSLTVSFAGASVPGDAMAGNKLIQIGILYSGSGTPNKKYLDGSFSANGTNNAASFGTPSSNLVVGKIDTQDRGGILYRWLIEDLNVSGRTPEYVVKKDWDYCHGIGEYAGKPTKRTFIDIV